MHPIPRSPLPTPDTGVQRSSQHISQYRSSSLIKYSHALFTCPQCSPRPLSVRDPTSHLVVPAPGAPGGRVAVRLPAFAMTSTALRTVPLRGRPLLACMWRCGWAAGLGAGPQGCGALSSRHLGAHAPNVASPWDADLARLADFVPPSCSPWKGEDVAAGSRPRRWVSAASLVGLGLPGTGDLPLLPTETLLHHPAATAWFQGQWYTVGAHGPM